MNSLDTAREAVYKAFDFIKSFDQEFQNLLLYGEAGTGKTFLCNCIAKQLLDDGFSVIYFTAFQLFEILEKQKFQNDSEVSGHFQNIFDCDLLIIDDLGAELSNTFTVSHLFLCLNERLLRKKSTLISTNFDLNLLSKTYTERISSRVLSNYNIIELFGDDIRIQKKKTNNDGGTNYAL